MASSNDHHCRSLSLPMLLTTLLVFMSLIMVGSCIENDEKFRQLQKMAQKSPVIRFNTPDMYNRFVTEAGRNYSFFVFFTATHPKYNCGPCVAIADEFTKFGASYEMFFGPGYNSESFLEKPFFLAQLEPSDCLEVFQSYQFSTVPHFAYVPSGSKKVTKLRDDQFLRSSQIDQFDIGEFVNNKISVEVPAYQSPLEKFGPLLAFAGTIFLIIRLARKYPNRVYSPMLWYILALVTYMIVMAGVVYNRIRNPPFMDVQGGRPVLIAPQPRTQYVAEGLLVAIVLAGLGVVFVAFGDVVPRIKNGWGKRIIFWFLAVILFSLLTTLNNIFFVKYNWSAFRFNRRFF